MNEQELERHKQNALLNCGKRSEWYSANIKYMTIDTLWRHFDDLNWIALGLDSLGKWQKDRGLTKDINTSRDYVYSQIVKRVQAESPDKTIHWCDRPLCNRQRKNEHGKCETCGRIPVKCEAWEVEACRKCR